jgi:hypothetical protein
MGYANLVRIVPDAMDVASCKGGSMTYEAPQVVDYGTLVALTAAQQNGGHLDRDFLAGTLRGDLTFS